MQRLIIRADGDLRTGTGHVMRCLALAQGWKDRGGTVSFFTHATIPQPLEKRLRNEGIAVVTHQHAPGSREDAEALCALAGTDAVVVVDGYVFGADYQRTIKAAGLPLLFIDDNGHVDHYAADWVLNQNIHAHESLYANREPHTRLLLGTRYALLRREFWRWRGWQREFREPATNLLITLGGSDADNVTLKVLESVAHMPGAETLQIKAVVGGGNPHLAELHAFAAASPLQIDILHNVTDMPEIMAWADMAVTAGGSTVWELCLMGVPACVIVTAENQRQSAETLAASGAVLLLDTASSADASIRLLRDAETGRKLSDKMQSVIDGRGVDRVIMHLNHEKMRLRPAQIADARLVWEWANETAVRSASFSSEPIPWEAHLRWFSNKVNHPDTAFYLAFDENEQSIGQIRFDQVRDNEAEISISLDHRWRGMGYGSTLIQMATQQVLREKPFTTLHAYAKATNIGSVRSFEKAGFKYIGATVIHETESTHWVYTRDCDTGEINDAD